MNIDISNCRLSYVLFSLFVAALIVFFLHGKFEKIDIILIPVFGVIVYLIIDFSAKRLFEKKLEKFAIEKFNFENYAMEHFAVQSPIEESPVSVGGSDPTLSNMNVVPELSTDQPVDQSDEQIPVGQIVDQSANQPLSEDEIANQQARQDSARYAL